MSEFKLVNWVGTAGPSKFVWSAGEIITKICLKFAKDIVCLQ